MKKINFLNRKWALIFSHLTFIGGTNLMLSSSALAFWGAGLWGGTQSCPYGDQTSISEDLLEEYDELGELLNETAKQKRDLKKKIREKKRKFSRLERNLSRYLNSSMVEALVSFVRDRKTPEDWNNCNGQGNQTPPPTGFCDNNTSRDWHKYLRENFQNRTHNEASSVCRMENVAKRPNSSSAQDSCQRYIGDLLDTDLASGESLSEMEDTLESLEEQEKDIKNQRKDLKKDAREEYRENLRELREEGTEAQVCFECARNKSKSSWYDTKNIANLLLTGVGGYLAYKGVKRSIAQNTALGYPTAPYTAASAMFPFVAQGLYGALNGGFGGGGFACAGTFGGGGGFSGGLGLNMFGSTGMNGMMGNPYLGLQLGGGAFGYPPGLFGGGGGLNFIGSPPGFGSGGLGGALSLGLTGGLPGYQYGIGGAGLQLGLGGGLGAGSGAWLGGGGAGSGAWFGGGLPGAGSGAWFGGGLPGAGSGAWFGGGGAGSGTWLGGIPGAGSGAWLGGLPGAGSGAWLGGSIGAGANFNAYEQHLKQQMEQYQYQMTIQQRYISEATKKQESISRLTQELYKIQNQIQSIATSPISYDSNVRVTSSSSSSSSSSSTSGTRIR